MTTTPPSEVVKLLTSLQQLMAHLTAAVPGTRLQRDWFLAHEVPDEFAAVLLRYGLMENGATARLVRMERSNCHDDAQRLGKRHGWELWTGLALSSDGCWRVHSWCRNRRGESSRRQSCGRSTSACA